MLFAEAPGEGDLNVYRQRTQRTTWPTAPFTEAAVIVGRRGGKSRTLALIAVYLACFRSYDAYLAPGVHIEIGTASFRSTRGYTYAAVLCDELALWRSDETSLNPDVEILCALRPGMLSIPGAVLVMASSPYAQRGELYATFRKHFGKDDARVLVWKASTLEMNPGVDKRVIAEAYEDESAKAEYGAEFRTDLADFVTRETTMR